MKLQVVIVLYKQKISESKSVTSLYDQILSLDLDISLLIYDNSPSPQKLEHAIMNMVHVVYVHDPSNGGLVPAYNQGLLLAKSNAASWMLLLDQDTVLTADYFRRLLSALDASNHDHRIVAYAPHIIVRGKCVAPSWFWMGIHRHIKRSWHGIALKPITSINSATTVSTSFMEAIGGFDRRFPLNYTDYWLYREIYSHGKMVMVLNCDLEHELSAANRDTFRPVAQYVDVLHHEGKFYRSSHSRAVIFVFWSRLMLRVLKHFFVFKDKGYSRAALTYIHKALLARSK